MGYLEIPLPRLSLSLGLILLAIAISRLRRLGLEGQLAWGAVRAAAQLLAIGYGLRLLFASDHPALVLGVLLIMLLVAAHTSASRIPSGPPMRALMPAAAAAIAAGTLAAVVPVLLFIVAPRPWLSARYVIPLGGMMLASAMNVVALVFERLFSLARSEQGKIEQLLALGATPAQALAPQLRAAVRAAMLPTLNGLLTVGIVSLPGMMTGQILTGTAPEQAVRYQIVIMYELVSVAAVAGTLAGAFGRRMLFTPRAQLRVFAEAGEGKARLPKPAPGAASPGARV